MENHITSKGDLTEEKSIQVMRDMIMVAKRNLKNNGILFILWGWLFTLGYLYSYLSDKLIMTYQMGRILKWTGNLLAVVAIVFTVYYVFLRQRKAVTYIGISLRFVWMALLPCLVLVNLIQANVMHEINFNLQHPIFMVFVAFATFVTGGILRYGLVIAGGVLFSLLAFGSSFLPLQDQMLLESVAWLLAFVVPGHIMYHSRKKQPHVQGT